jgi:hypothetical protein
VDLRRTLRVFPLVVDPVIQGVRLKRVLVDGGSGLNILFLQTLRHLGLSIDNLDKVDTPFYGLVPGKGSVPLDRVTLPTTFGTRDNYRTEYLEFYVADFNTAFHAILGRPALTKLMAVPHYAYMILKVPGPAGVFAVRGNLSTSFECERESLATAEAFDLSARMEETLTAAKTLPASDQEIPQRNPSAPGIEPAVKTQRVVLDSANPAKTTVIGEHALSPK